MFLCVFAVASACSNKELQVTQGFLNRRPDGIPMYKVEITNTCSDGCSISDVHLKCGEFSSATLINPMVFKRLANDDCLVNDGEPMPTGQTTSFTYATNFMYPLSVSTTKITCP